MSQFVSFGQTEEEWWIAEMSYSQSTLINSKQRNGQNLSDLFE